jgi:hypothetical protein
MLNEALEGLSLPDIINTKVLEDITINPKAQETFGRFMRDWLLNWGSSANLFDVSSYINMHKYDTGKYNRHIFVRLYKKNGGNGKDLFAKKDYYAFTPKAWDERLEEFKETNYFPPKIDKWRERLTRDLDPGKGNNIDREIFDKTMDEFIDLRLYLHDQARLWYGVTSRESEIEPSIDSKGENYSAKWAKMRKILKSVRKYLAKRDMADMFYDEIERRFNANLLRAYNIASLGRDLRKLKEFLNEEGKNWVDIQKLLKDPGNFRDSWDAIRDFLKNLKYREAYDTMCADLGDGDQIAPEGKPCIIKNYNDGYFWFSRGGRSCEIFGEEGRNCGGGEYTLIDLQRKIKRGDRTKRSWLIGLDYDVDDRILYQILGFGNSFPMEKYWSYIRDFIETFDVKDIDPKVFNYLAENSKVSEEEIFKFIMAVGNDSVKENWIKRVGEKKEMRDDALDDLMARQLQEKVRTKLQKNLALKSPMEIDPKLVAINEWYDMKKYRRNEKAKYERKKKLGKTKK